LKFLELGSCSFHFLDDLVCFRLPQIGFGTLIVRFDKLHDSINDFLYRAERAPANLREAKSRPILERIRNWLETRRADTLPKSPLGQAIGYARAQWTALNRYVENGDLNIDNNRSENALRKVALGRKNYLFFGNDEGGRRAANFIR
jgi:hypothetical protein